MAESALNADGLQRPAVVEEAGHTDHRVKFKQGQRRRGVVQIHGTFFQIPYQVSWKRTGIYFQANGEGRLWTYPRPCAPLIGSGNRLMESQRIAPKGFIAESVKPKDIPAPYKHLSRVLESRIFNVHRRGRVSVMFIALVSVRFIVFIRRTTSRIGGTR